MDYNSRVVLEFAKFLRKNKCLERYCYNYLKYHRNILLSMPKDASVADRAKIILAVINGVMPRYVIHPENLIVEVITSFDWWYTEEGNIYWSKISDKWAYHWDNIKDKLK